MDLEILCDKFSEKMFDEQQHFFHTSSPNTFRNYQKKGRVGNWFQILYCETTNDFQLSDQIEIVPKD